ncbi:MAG TPA: thiamine phosphate synthase [Polyangiaceae bacterium]|nr:thiamine phosphate synthase [Polyangiaceae bacterium]
MRGLYAIADVGTLDGRGIDPVAFADAVLRASPAALQLRAKDVPPRQALALLRELAPMCHRAGVPLIANDRPDLAILAGCDLVHVGQTDMPIDRVRRIAPGIGVGVSTHNLEQLDLALCARPSYVAFGPVYETSTKKDPDAVVGLAGLRAAHARARAAGVPLVAIGGITLERARELVGASDAVAVISGLLPPEATAVGSRAELFADVAARALAFQRLFVPKAVAAGAAQ